MIERMIPLSLELYHALKSLVEENEEANIKDTRAMRLAYSVLERTSHYKSFIDEDGPIKI